MTIMEFRVKLQDLASQADLQAQKEKSELDKDRKSKKPASRDRLSTDLQVKQAAIDSLQKYRDELMKLSFRINDALDHKQPVDAKMYKEMMTAFGDLIYKANVYADRYPSMNTQPKALKNLEAIVAGVDVSSGKTLQDAIAGTLENAVKLKSNPDFMGDASSQRFMVKVKNPDGTTTEGFFTRERPLLNFDPNGAITNILEQSVKDANPKDEMLEKFVKRILNSPDKSNSIIFCILSDKNKKTYADKIGNDRNVERMLGRAFKEADTLEGYLPGLMKELRLIDGTSGITLDDIKNNANIMDLLQRVRSSFTQEEQNRINAEFAQYHISAGSGIHATTGSVKAGRNYAFSKVAALLGASDVIAKSVPMTAEFNGQHYRGVFMEKAEGTCYVPKQKQDMLLTELSKMKPNSFDGEPLKQLAQIQILDYICQNADRHQSNFLIKLDEQGKVSKVTGIDNDLSFGNREIAENQAISNDTPLDTIMVIPKEMAELIQSLKKETLIGALADTGLSNSEITSAAERFEKLKNYIDYNKEATKPFTEGRIKVVSKDAWNGIKVDDLGTSTNTNAIGTKNYLFSIFGIAANIKDDMVKANKLLDDPITRNLMKDYRTEKAKEKKKEYADTDRTKLVSEEGLKNHKKNLEGFLKRFKGTENIFQDVHDPYKFMRAELVTLAKETPTEVMSMGERVEFEEQLKSLEEKAKDYIAYKAPQNNPRKNGIARLKEATALVEYLQEYRKSFHKAYNEMLEANLEKENEEYFNHDRKVNRIADVLVKGALQSKKAPKDRSAVEMVEQSIRNTKSFRELTDCESMKNDKDTVLDYYFKLAERKPEDLYKAYLKLVPVHDAKSPEKAQTAAHVKTSEVSRPVV